MIILLTSFGTYLLESVKYILYTCSFLFMLFFHPSETIYCLYFEAYFESCFLPRMLLLLLFYTPRFLKRFSTKMLSLGEVAKPARALAKRGLNCFRSNLKITTVISIVEKEVRKV